MGRGTANSTETIDGSPIVELRAGPLGRQYATTDNGLRYTRQAGTTWQRRTSPPPESLSSRNAPVKFYLVMQEQEAKEDHWCLFVAQEGQAGAVYQVGGDNLCMTYRYRNGVRVFQSASYQGQHVFIQDSISPAQHGRIQYWAHRVAPPSAASMREIRANCQTWCIVVLEQLLREGIGSIEALAEARRRRELLPYEQRTQPVMHTMHVQQPSIQPLPQQHRRQPRREKEDQGCMCCAVM